MPPAFPDRGLHDARDTAAQGSLHLAVGGAASKGRAASQSDHNDRRTRAGGTVTFRPPIRRTVRCQGNRITTPRRYRPMTEPPHDERGAIPRAGLHLAQREEC